jgi:APA family basic amino acid/polyamine antiporter
VLRFTRPDLPRPYRAWGYPFSPLVFLLVTGFMMYYLLTTQPKPSLLGLLIMISGLLIYAIFRKQPGDGHAAVPLGRE